MLILFLSFFFSFFSVWLHVRPHGRACSASSFTVQSCTEREWFQARMTCWPVVSLLDRPVQKWRRVTRPYFFFFVKRWDFLSGVVSDRSVHMDIGNIQMQRCISGFVFGLFFFSLFLILTDSFEASVWSFLTCGQFLNVRARKLDAEPTSCRDRNVRVWMSYI